MLGFEFSQLQAVAKYRKSKKRYAYGRVATRCPRLSQPMPCATALRASYRSGDGGAGQNDGLNALSRQSDAQGIDVIGSIRD